MIKNQTRILLTITAVTIFLASVFVLVTMLGRSSRSKPSTEMSANGPTALSRPDPAQITAIDQLPLEPDFIEIVPVTRHIEKYQEYPAKDGEISDLKVSPDGERIVYVATGKPSGVISVVYLDDGKSVDINVGLDDYADAAWSTDGKNLVFCGMKNHNWEIYLYNLNAKELRQLTADPGRKKSWPRYSPHKFDGYFRIAYVSEQDGRKDIWWVRESGEYDMPITQRDSTYDSSVYWDSLMPPPRAITTGGDSPEWSPSGNLLLYHTAKGYSILGYTFYTWWKERKLPVPKIEGVLTWSPNQTSFLRFDPKSGRTSVIPRDNPNQPTPAVNEAVKAVQYFPDGRAFAFVTRKNGKCVIAVQPYDDPLGDIVNLWMYPYSSSQKNKLKQNQLLLLDTRFEQVYNIYETERYYCGGVDPNFPARPYIVTSDAVLETYYACFAALYAAIERSRLHSLLLEFSRQSVSCALENKASKDAIILFETGLGLLDPKSRTSLTSETVKEINRVEGASGREQSLWGKWIDYSDFNIRGKYERDTVMQGYFRAVKWYQAFTLNLDNAEDRIRASEILSIANTSRVLPPLKDIFSVYQSMIGESRYCNPLNVKSIPGTGKITPFKPGLPWIQDINRFRLFPSIYTLDAYVFDELVTHLDRPFTVGTATAPRLLPKGLDVMAGLGSDEAYEILINEFQEGRFENYETALIKVRDKIRGFSQNTWNANLYQDWLFTLQALVREPDSVSPGFTKVSAWKRKQLNTALGSWVNLRYETIAVVEQSGAECGEGGYERLNIGKPKGYVEPNPEFFRRLDAGFAKIGVLFDRAFEDKALVAAAQKRVQKYRAQIQSLETMAQKELNGQDLSNDEYEEILEIGGTIEQFILIMGSLNGDDNDHAVGLPDPVRKIVDVQKDEINGVRLYEALGYANEINVAVPFHGRRQIAKGAVYSYYEFPSHQILDSRTWQEAMDAPYPSWIVGLYDGVGTTSLDKLPDLETEE